MTALHEPVSIKWNQCDRNENRGKLKSVFVDGTAMLTEA
jgi:hypothetical protein